MSKTTKAKEQKTTELTDVKVFSHKGLVGICTEGPGKTAGLLNDPTRPGQLGVLVDAKHVKISTEAYRLLLQVKRGHDDIGDVMCNRTSDGRVAFGWLGAWTAMVYPEEVEGSNSCDFTLLQGSIDPDLPTPQEFIEAVERRLGNKGD